MKRIVLLFLLFIVFTQNILAQNITYNAFTIPDSLTKSANSVVRHFDTEIDLVSPRKMIIKIKKAITILNKLGNHDAELVFYYDKSTNIKRIKIFTYNSMGIEEKEVKNKEIKDYSAADGFSLFNDNRLKYYKHVPTSYPYTIYYEFEYETSNTAFIPRWFPVNSYFQSLENSIYTIKYPEDITLKKSEQNFTDYSVKNTVNSNHTLSYEAQHIPAVKYEEYSLSIIDITPFLILSTNKFHLEGFDGTANDWNEFGKWMHKNLLASRMDLPEGTKNKIKLLVKGIEDPIEKAKIVYDYVQKKTRYVSIQVGIGGWMPMLASDVDRLSYGDCKALTNYTKTLMDAAGVESYYTAVYADNRRRNMNKDVVSVQGNHVFLYIPTDEQDIWLECTSQDVPFGYQGSFTDDRDVLVISDKGGELKHTSSYKDEDSYQFTNASYSINKDGGLKGKVHIKSAGVQYKNHFHLERKSEREINEYYKSKYWPYINNLTLTGIEFKNNKDSILFTENIEVQAKDYASFSGERMLFHLNAFNRITSIPERYRNRKLPFEISRGYFDEDKFLLTIPDSFKVEAVPENITIEKKFGTYSFSIERISENQLKYHRRIILKKGSYNKEDYKKFRAFKKSIVKHDNSKIVLLKK